jgi:hypothetical protein
VSDGVLDFDAIARAKSEHRAALARALGAIVPG